MTWRRMSRDDAVCFVEQNYCLACGDDQYVKIVSSEYCPDCGHYNGCMECGACQRFRENPDELDDRIVVCDMQDYNCGCIACDEEEEENSLPS